MGKWQWGGKPVIFGEDGLPAMVGGASNPRFQAEWDADEAERTCPWCGLLCESVEAELVHEEGCDE